MTSTRVAVLYGRGLAGHATLPALLADYTLVRPQEAQARQAELVLGWGRKPSGEQAAAWAAARGLPLARLEDGFLRSVGLGHQEPPLSVVVDDLGVYYDAGAPSRLEALIATPLDAAQTARALALAAAWREGRVSKYNHAREDTAALPPGAVLVVDQTCGDASVRLGCAHADAFDRMLEAALDEHPGAPVVLKTHPDVVAGVKHGCFGRLSRVQRQRVQVLARDVHPPGLLERATAVYTVSSQMGFEALLWGCPVRCFGIPFYAGWGLTTDELAAPARRQPVPLAQLVHAALVGYTRQIDAETWQPSTPEALLAWLALQRRQRERYPAQVQAVGISPWKRPIVRRFFAGSEVRFARPGRPLPRGATVAVWGQSAPPLPAQAQVVRLEDGFLRSVGLGADLVQPLSWVMDGQGLYYDAQRPSALETLLATATFDAPLLARAAALRERILALGLSKYNLDGEPWRARANGRRRVLVIGQVESDAALTWGAPGLRRNIDLLRAVRGRCPDAHLIYKPHPDVVARLRAPGLGERGVAAHCDEIVTAPIDGVLRQVDEVHALTSLAGFEALLRGVPVVTWGCPFYAGWGLTQDEVPLPRRGRTLSLDALVAGVLILYPTYLGRRSGHFATPEAVLDALVQWREEGLRSGPRPWRRAAWRWLRGVTEGLRRAP